MRSATTAEAGAGTRVFHVSLSGEDSSPGTAAAPFATLERARQAVRECDVRGSFPISVRIHAGTYYLKQPFSLGPDDSGAPGAWVTWTAAPTEKVTVTTAGKLTARWQPYRDGIWRCRIPESAMTGKPFGLLLVNGRRQVRARFPSLDPAGTTTCGYEGSAYDGGGQGKPGYAYPTEPVEWPANATIRYDPNTFTPHEWAHPEDGILHTFNGSFWGSLQYHLRAVDRDGHRLILGDGGWQINQTCLGAAARRITERSPYYIENIFEELDAPEEWFFDRRENVLYLLPSMGIDPNDANITLSRHPRIIECTGTPADPVHHIRLQGLHCVGTETTFMAPHEFPSQGDWGICREGAVFLQGAENCEIQACHFNALGGNAVFLSDSNARITVTENHFAEIGESAICMVGKSHLRHSPSLCARCGHVHGWTWGVPSEEIPRDCVIEDNVIHDIGFYGKQTAGVFLALCRHISIRHNHIFDTPRAAICVNDGLHGGHLVEFNDIHDTVRETGDHGPFNAWGREPFWCYAQSHMDASHPAGDVLRWAAETTVIRHNRFRDSSGWGIDLDDGTSNYHVVGNLCMGVSVKLREGDHRTVENNIFVNPANPPSAHRGYEGNSDIFRRNIVVMSQAAERVESDANYQDHNRGAMVKLIRPPHKGAWFREWDHNLYFGDLGEFRAIVVADGESRAYEMHAWQALGWDRHSRVADPLFANPAEGDFRLRDDSPALAMGFERIPLDRFGPRRKQ